MSKETVVTAGSATASGSPGRMCIDAMKLAKARCVTTTPFGCPVEPEV
jgi:hypothetical protein